MCIHTYVTVCVWLLFNSICDVLICFKLVFHSSIIGTGSFRALCIQTRNFCILKKSNFDVVRSGKASYMELIAMKANLIDGNHFVFLITCKISTSVGSQWCNRIELLCTYCMVHCIVLAYCAILHDNLFAVCKALFLVYSCWRRSTIIVYLFHVCITGWLAVSAWAANQSIPPFGMKWHTLGQI